MQVKTTTKLRKELQTIRINFIKKGTSLKRFCAESSINDANVYKIFNGTWKGEKATEMKNRLIAASKGKTDFSTEQSRSTTE
ncbi:MAG: hypothetical protein WCL34_14475 [Methylococcaceae bacterium]